MTGERRFTAASGDRLDRMIAAALSDHNRGVREVERRVADRVDEIGKPIRAFHDRQRSVRDGNCNGTEQTWGTRNRSGRVLAIGERREGFATRHSRASNPRSHGWHPRRAVSTTRLYVSATCHRRMFNAISLRLPFFCRRLSENSYCLDSVGRHSRHGRTVDGRGRL